MTTAPQDIQLWARRYTDWLTEHALPLWNAKGLDREHGGAYELIGQDGEPLAVPKRARVQARQVFVYAAAHTAGFEGPWIDASDHVWRFFSERYKRPDGLYRTRVTAEGAPDDEEAFLYDQAFVLMSAATLLRAAPERLDVREAAEALRGRLYALMRAPAGRGFREAGDHPFQANAHMHLFEASLAWVELGGGPDWLALAEEIEGLATETFIDAEGGYLREFFDADWNPASGEDGTHLEPGHQFEWAWLLERWSRHSGSDAVHETARRLFAAGRRGVDDARNVAVDEMDAPDMVWRGGRARLWPQTEAVKAALILAERAEGEEAETLRRHAVRSAEGLWSYLKVPVTGLWWDKLQADGRFDDEPAPASSFYHILGAIFALRGAAGV